MPDERAESGFTAVPWLPPFRLDTALLRAAELEVTHAPDALLPFSLLRPAPDGAGFAPEPHGALPDIPRARRWAAATARAASDANAALRGFGLDEAWRAAAAARRGWYLRAVDAGTPPPADQVAASIRAVPQGFRHLGKALPTAEAVRLLAPLGRVCELGAGFGLFARALDRAGMAVAASDPDPAAGVAFPVRRGFDAAATLAAFAAMGPVPPLLIVWPQPEEGAWFAEVFARAAPGQIIAMASPEYEFCASGGLATAPLRQGAPGPGWQALEALAARLAREWEAVGAAPVVASGWPVAPTPLRLWRRR
jgi:hypothetical protein